MSKRHNRKDKVRLAPLEARILNALETNRPSDTNAIIAAAYVGVRKPFHVRTTVNTAVRNLRDKLDYNGDRYRVVISDPKGPIPVTITKVVRK